MRARLAQNVGWVANKLNPWGAKEEVPSANSAEQAEAASLLEKYQDKKLILQAIEVKYQTQLEAMLEPRIYQAILNGAMKDGRYILTPQDKEEDSAIYYYKGIFNAIRDARKFLDFAIPVHEHAINLSHKKWLISKAFTNWVKLNRDLNNVFAAYVNLYDSLGTIAAGEKVSQVCQFAMRIASFDGIYKECEEAVNLFSPVKTFAGQLSVNPFYTASKNQSAALRRIAGLAPLPVSQPPLAAASGNDAVAPIHHAAEDDDAPPIGAPHAQAEADSSSLAAKVFNLKGALEKIKELTSESALEKIAIELVGKDLPRDSMKKITETNKTIHALLEKVNTFSASPQNFSDVISLLYGLYPLANNLIKEFPQAYVSINKALKGHFLTTAYQLNLVFQDIFLSADRLEMQGYLKENYLLSFGNIAGDETKTSFLSFSKSFNAWLERMNCEFKPHLRSPYTFAKADQRTRLYNAEAAKPYAMIGEVSNRLLILKQRADDGRKAWEDEQKLNEKTKAEQLSHSHMSKKQAIYVLIDQRIAELQREIDEAWVLFGNTKGRKIQSLQLLKDTVKASANGLELSYLFSKGYMKGVLERKNFAYSPYLLENGRTAKMYDEIRYLAASHADLLNAVDNRMTELENTRFWFFAESRTKKMLARVEALAHLKKWLTTDGYGVDDALEAVKVDNMGHFTLIHEHETAMLDEIRKIEAHLPKALIGKRLITAPKKDDPALLQSKLQILDEFREGLEAEKLALQTNTSSFGFFQGSGIAVLQERLAGVDGLKEWLEKPGYRLDNALIVLESSHPAGYERIKNETALFDKLRAIETGKPLADATVVAHPTGPQAA